VRVTIKGDAPAEKPREIVEQSRARSAVYDVITNGVPVAIEWTPPDAQNTRHGFPQARISVLAGPGLRDVDLGIVRSTRHDDTCGGSIR
jgi:hypothetical protein